MRRSPAHLFLLAALTLALGCDSGSAPTEPLPLPEARLDILATYSDGTPAPALIGANRIEPFSDEYPPTVFPTYGTRSTEGRASFTVPVDTYDVYVEAFEASPTGYPFEYRLQSHFVERLILSEEGASVSGYVGATLLGAPCDGLYEEAACVGLWSEELHPDTRDPVAMAYALYFDSEFLRVGDRTDLVERVHLELPLSFSDDRATSARVRIVPIPAGFWDAEYPYETPVEAFDGVEETAVYDVPLAPIYDSDVNYGCLPLELDPEFFFGTEHGFAIVVEGESMNHFDEPSYVLISYAWEDDRPNPDIPLDCEGDPIP